VQRRGPYSSTLNHRVEHALADLVAAGLSINAAAEALGIPSGTVTVWLSRGRADATGRFARLVDSIEAAQAERAHHVAQLVEAARRHSQRPERNGEHPASPSSRAAA
jgi:hypothetical protein